jgi:MFS family permease
MSTTGATIAAPPSSELKRLATTPAVLCLILFSAAYITNAMDRSIFATLLPMISKTQHYGLKTGGLLATIFNLGIGLAGLPTGYLLDRWSRRSVLILGMVIYSVATLATVVSLSVLDMAFYRTITGIGEGMQLTALFVAGGSYFYKNKAFVLGCINVGFGIGGVIGPYWGTIIALRAGTWKTPFVVFCFLGLAMALAIRLLIPKNFSEQKAIRNVVDNSVAVDNIPENFLNHNIKLLMGSAFVQGAVGFGFQGLYVTYLIRHLHYSQIQAGTVYSFYGFGCMLPMLGGWLGDRFSNRGAVITAFGSMAVITFLIFNVATNPYELYALTFLQAFCYSGVLYVNHVALFQRCVRPNMVGRATGLCNTTHFISGTLSGFVFALLAEKLGWGWAGILQLSLLSVAAIFLVWMLDPKQMLDTRHKLSVGGH